MDLQEIIKYHRSQLEYNKRKNKEFRNMHKWQKNGYYKAIYISKVLEYRRNIKWHREAIKELVKCLDH